MNIQYTNLHMSALDDMSYPGANIICHRSDVHNEEYMLRLCAGFTAANVHRQRVIVTCTGYHCKHLTTKRASLRRALCMFEFALEFKRWETRPALLARRKVSLVREAADAIGLTGELNLFGAPSYMYIHHICMYVCIYIYIYTHLELSAAPCRAKLRDPIPCSSELCHTTLLSRSSMSR